MPFEQGGYVAGTWDLDPVHSHIGFVARHLMVSKVRGHFNKFDVRITTEPNPLESSVTVTIDAASIDTGNETRDNDLRSENFLDAVAHPLITFQSTGVTEVVAEAGGDKFRVDGDLTIKGVTKPVTLDLEANGFGPDPYGGTRAGFSATTEIDRTEFGITFNAPIPGGVMISEKVQVEIEGEAILRKPE